MAKTHNMESILKNKKKLYLKYVNSSTKVKLVNLADYLGYVKDLYVDGIIGYIMYPLWIQNILGTTESIELDYPEMAEIIKLVKELDLPNHHLAPDIDRERDTKRLTELIEYFTEKASRGKCT